VGEWEILVKHKSWDIDYGISMISMLNWENPRAFFLNGIRSSYWIYHWENHGILRGLPAGSNVANPQ
jgi:hypothetical protein